MDDHIQRRRKIGQRIQERRKLLGMTQAELARSLDETANAVSHYENGHRPIVAEMLETIAQTLEVPVSYFFGQEVRAVDMEGLTVHDRETLQIVVRRMVEANRVRGGRK